MPSGTPINCNYHDHLLPYNCLSSYSTYLKFNGYKTLNDMHKLTSIYIPNF